MRSMPEPRSRARCQWSFDAPFVAVSRTPKTEGRCRVVGRERTSKGGSHESRVIEAVVQPESSGTAELLYITVLLSACVRGDQLGVEVQNPLPHEPVKVVHAEVVR